MSRRCLGIGVRVAAASLLTCGLVAGCASSTGMADAHAPAGERTSAAPAVWPEGVETFDDLSAGHVDGDVDYDTSPPVGGDHSSAWQTCGVYDEPIGDSHAVHSLEHGAVWITYQPDLPEEQVQELRELVGTSGYVLLSPYEDQDSPVALSAWGVQLKVDDAADERAGRFLTEYVNGPQTPEPGAPCSGGVGASVTHSPA